MSPVFVCVIIRAVATAATTNSFLSGTSAIQAVRSEFSIALYKQTQLNHKEHTQTRASDSHTCTDTEKPG